jgi:hypothetical protein
MARDLKRVRPLQNRETSPKKVAATLPEIAAGPDALTDEELSALREEAHRAFVDGAAGAPKSARSLGVARLIRCTLDAGVGRRLTAYQARCYASLRVGGVSLIEVEGKAIRRTRTRALPPGEAKKAAGATRHPLLSAADARVVLTHAAHVAALQLRRQMEWEDPDASKGGNTPFTPNRGDLLKSLKAQISPAKEAALIIDLARVAQDKDGPVFWSRLDSENPLTRRAAAQGLATLCPRGLAAFLIRSPPPEDDQIRLDLDDALACEAALAPTR